MEIDPIGLVRNRRGPSGETRSLEQYVNDRPYTASSFLSVVIARTFGTAISGKSKERQALADTPLPFELHIAVVRCRGGEVVLRKLIEPLGRESGALAFTSCLERNVRWRCGSSLLASNRWSDS